MQTATTTLSQKYQVVIPKTIRQAMGLRQGTKVVIKSIDQDTAVIMKMPTNITEKLAGLGKDVWEKLGGGEAYLKRERATWDKKRLD